MWSHTDPNHNIEEPRNGRTWTAFVPAATEPRDTRSEATRGDPNRKKIFHVRSPVNSVKKLDSQTILSVNHGAIIMSVSAAK